LIRRRMPSCRNCSQHFPNTVRIEGIVRNLSSRLYCLRCSPFRSHNTRPIVAGLSDVAATRGQRDAPRACRRCGRLYQFDHSKGHKATICNSCSANARRSEMKERALEYKGQCCQLCGYNRCKRSLVFHHLDPAKKEWSVNFKQMARSWMSLKRELDKCVLLCANCHGEVHAGMRCV
jgi:hypothetical protein